MLTRRGHYDQVEPIVALLEALWQRLGRLGRILLLSTPVSASPSRESRSPQQARSG
jgi:hypothetical protein